MRGFDPSLGHVMEFHERAQGRKDILNEMNPDSETRLKLARTRIDKTTSQLYDLEIAGLGDEEMLGRATYMVNNLRGYLTGLQEPDFPWEGTRSPDEKIGEMQNLARELIIPEKLDHLDFSDVVTKAFSSENFSKILGS